MDLILNTMKFNIPQQQVNFISVMKSFESINEQKTIPIFRKIKRHSFPDHFNMMYHFMGRFFLLCSKVDISWKLQVLWLKNVNAHLVVSAVYLIFCYYTVSQLLISAEIMLLSIFIVNLKSHARFFKHCKRIQAKQNAFKSSLGLLSCFEICHSVFHIQLSGC